MSPQDESNTPEEEPGEGAEVLAWMKRNGVPLTLEAFVDLNWFGDWTADEVLDEPELAAQIPKSLLPD